ncbi:MAG: Omp28-related outer membrane protein [Bacteroidota bacterium]
MKHSFIISIAALFIVLAACKEEAPYINYTPDTVTYETTYVDMANVPTPQLREVLVEDISGVRCVNCPDAAVIVKGLKANFPGRVNSITIYPNTPSLNSLTLPVNKPEKGFVSKYDLRTDAGGQMLAFLGTPNSLPNGYVNRKLYAGKTDRFIDRTEWADKVTSEKDSVPPVNIYVTETSYGTDGKLNVTLELKFTSDLTGDYNISMALIQDSIIDVQETTDPNIGATYIADYPHMHVLRKMFTSNLGDKINTPTTTLVRGRVVTKRYSIDVLPETFRAPFDKKHLAVLAFVHRGSDNVVIHSKEFEVAE